MRSPSFVLSQKYWSHCNVSKMQVCPTHAWSELSQKKIRHCFHFKFFTSQAKWHITINDRNRLQLKRKVQHKYLVRIHFGHQIVIQGNMKVCLTICADFVPYYQSTYPVFSSPNGALFRVPYPLHTRAHHRMSHSWLNQDSSVNNNWLQPLRVNFRCSAVHFFRLHGIFR